MSLDLRSDRPPVPEVPREITGPCVYGYLITNEHRNHFQSLYPDTKEFQISTPASLVSYASVVTSKIYIADAVPVYDHQGGKAVCLALIDYQNRGRLIDQRRSNKFITDIKRALGIKGIPDSPDWYPCRFKRLGVRRT